ncbi:MAG: N-acetylmuramoyl-L-alanine amidase, partial [Parabacteroides sp.]|nr:N-acetylmuramoyl-L-alanine amidase [Parabacteroides sp.]
MSVKHSIRIFFIFIIALVYTGSLTAQEKAYPKNGEGITLFLKRFNRTGRVYHQEFIELNKGKLGKHNSLRMGVKYTLPPLTSAPQKKKNKNYQPLFGKVLASYQVTSSDLKGACFYLVSGHGGPDPGAIGK